MKPIALKRDAERRRRAIAAGRAAVGGAGAKGHAMFAIGVARHRAVAGEPIARLLLALPRCGLALEDVAAGRLPADVAGQRCRRGPRGGGGRGGGAGSRVRGLRGEQQEERDHGADLAGFERFGDELGHVGERRRVAQAHTCVPFYTGASGGGGSGALGQGFERPAQMSARLWSEPASRGSGSGGGSRDAEMTAYEWPYG